MLYRETGGVRHGRRETQGTRDELEDGDEADEKEPERDQRIQEMLDEARLANPETAFLGKGKWHDPFN
ncbi:hypothetical protein [Coleofasciculus sp.]|uniref:hypothetical protein n=1 Tax=Coleofasciculus sp. TaxID=3100458 RepID=UPI0039F8F911